MDNPLISVVIPVYNAEKYLEACINSVLMANLDCLDIILIDDGSKDSSGKMCDRYAEQYESIRVIHTTNKGVSSARNKGIDVAKGEYLFFLDSDDFIDSKKLCSCLISLRESNCDMLICGYNICDQAGNVTQQNQNQNIGIFDGEKACIAFINDEIRVCMGSFFVSKEMIKDIQFEKDIRYGEDVSYILKCMMHCQRICVNDDCLCNYRQNFDSAMHKVSVDRFDSYRTKKRLYQYTSLNFEHYETLIFVMKSFYLPHDLVLCLEAMSREGLGYYKLRAYTKQTGIDSEIAEMLNCQIDANTRNVLEQWESNPVSFYWKRRIKTYKYIVRSALGRIRRRIHLGRIQ